MKKINLFLISYALVFFTVSCSSDDDGDVLNNPETLSIGDTEIQLKAGALENIESFNGLLFRISAKKKNTLNAVAVCPDGKLCRLCSFTPSIRCSCALS